jgi:hypothetical protein
MAGMNDDRAFEGAIQELMVDEFDKTPASTIDAVLLAVRTTPQERDLRIPWRTAPMFTPARLLSALAAVLVVAIPIAIGAGFLGGPERGVGAPSASPSPNHSAVPSSIETPGVFGTPRPTIGGSPIAIVIPPPASERPVGSSEPVGSALPLPASGPLAPGRYAIGHIVGTVPGYTTIDVTLPAGWVVDGRRIVKNAGQDDELALSWWVVGDVFFDPCHWETSPVSPLDMMGHEHGPSDTVTIREPLTAGLAGQLGRAPSAISQASIGGWFALKIELTIPTEMAITACDGGQYVSWSDRGSDHAFNNYAQPGQIDDVYMVDVDRALLTIDVSHMPGASASDLAELQAIVDSMVI